MSEVIDKESFDGYDLKGNITSFNSARKCLLNNLIANMEKRFETKKEVICATAITKLKTYPHRLSDQPGCKIVKKYRITIISIYSVIFVNNDWWNDSWIII